MDLPEADSETVPLTTVCDRSVTQCARSRHSVSGYFMAILIVGIISLFKIVFFRSTLLVFDLYAIGLLYFFYDIF